MTDWQEDRERYERENPQWRITETPEEAFKRHSKNLLMSETRNEFWARKEKDGTTFGVKPRRALMQYKAAAKMFEVGTKIVAKKGPTKEVVKLRARVRELEDIVAKLMGEMQ